MFKPFDENQNEEIINFFIAAKTTPKNLPNFQPSDILKERVSDLIFREKVGNLSIHEKAELDRYLQIEHLLRLAKAREN